MSNEQRATCAKYFLRESVCCLVCMNYLVLSVSCPKGLQVRGIADSSAVRATATPAIFMFILHPRRRARIIKNTHDVLKSLKIVGI